MNERFPLNTKYLSELNTFPLMSEKKENKNKIKNLKGNFYLNTEKLQIIHIL